MDIFKSTTLCMWVCGCVFSSSNSEDLARSKVLTLVYDPGFHLETPNVLFINQTLYGVTSAILIQALCSIIALKISDTQISSQRTFLW